MPLSLIIHFSFTYCSMQSQHDPVMCRQGFECKGRFISIAEKYKRAETICKGQRLGNNSTNQCWIHSRCTEVDTSADRSAFNTNIIQNREQVCGQQDRQGSDDQANNLTETGLNSISNESKNSHTQ